MQKLFLTFVLAASISLTFAQKAIKPVVIDGILAEKGTFTKIYLDTLNGNNPWIFASAPINSDGTFQFNVLVPNTDLYRLRLDDKNYIMLILSPGEHVKVKTPGSKLGIDANISGSLQTELLYNTIHGQARYDIWRDSLNRKYNENKSLPNNESMNSLLVKKLVENDSLQKAFLKTQMSKHPASLAWLFFQDKLNMAADFDIIDKTEAAMYKAFPKNGIMQQYHSQIEIERKTAVGHPAPEIALQGVDGKILRLSSLKGKVVLIDFWASWCGPCRRENPNVVKIYEEYKSKGFEIFSVSLDRDKPAWLAAIAKDNLSWPNHVSDLKYWKSEGAQIYGVTAIPYTVLVDKKGKIASKKLRGEELENKVKELCK